MIYCCNFPSKKKKVENQVLKDIVVSRFCIIHYNFLLVFANLLYRTVTQLLYKERENQRNKYE